MIYDLVPLDQIAVIFTGPPKPAERVRTVLRSDGSLAARFVSVGALRDGTHFFFATTSRGDRVATRPWFVR